MVNGIVSGIDDACCLFFGLNSKYVKHPKITVMIMNGAIGLSVNESMNPVRHINPVKPPSSILINFINSIILSFRFGYSYGTATNRYPCKAFVFKAFGVWVTVVTVETLILLYILFFIILILYFNLISFNKELPFNRYQPLRH